MAKVWLSVKGEKKDDWVVVSPQGEPDILWDLRFRLPFADKEIDELYAEHVLELLSFRQRTLPDWIRVLRPGGLIRIKTYDLLALAQEVKRLNREGNFSKAITLTHRYFYGSQDDFWSSHKAAFDYHWFFGQLGYWGCRQIRRVSELEGEWELVVEATRMVRWADCQAAREGKNLLTLPLDKNGIKDYRGYEEFAPLGFNYEVYNK